MVEKLPNSLREINHRETSEKLAIYRRLVPDWILADYGIDPATEMYDGHRAVHYLCPEGSRALEITVRRDTIERDPILYLNMADTFNQQIMVLLVVVNDPNAPRFSIDVDAHGNQTHFGTTTRNIAAEISAMRAGLAPGQIRAGLRVFKRSVPVFEDFIARMGHDIFLIEPLAYHNAIVFERYGFNYMRGLKDMQAIHRDFQPNGDLYARLTEGNPFRQPSAWQTVRGRSWAIHDGILGHPFTGFQMYKRIGIHAGINTFPDTVW